MIKDSDLLNYIYTILTDKRNTNKYSFVQIRDKDTYETAGFGEACNLIIRLFDEAIAREKGGENEVHKSTT